MTRYVFYSWDKKRDIDKEIINRADVYLISEREKVFSSRSNIEIAEISP